MVAERLVNWSKEAQEFFDRAVDNSLVLDLIISYGCVSQTGYGFEDLVNSINSTSIKKKIKKVNITDTSYLYRHCIPEFAHYADKNASSSVWYMNNKAYINNLEVDMNLQSWAENINNEEFKDWHKQIVRNYAGDENGSGVCQKFRELVIADASVAAYKGNGTFQQCVDFILEECAYVCTHLKNSIVVYPMEFYNSINYVIEQYKLNLTPLFYKPSSYSRRKNENIKYVKIDKDIFRFLTGTLNANFFIIDRNGNYIYKNSKLTEIIGDIPANIVAPEVWAVSMDIMKTGEQKIVEEKYGDKHYLSVKAPLIIDDEVEGVIGLAVDITEKKRAEQLERQKELSEMANKWWWRMSFYVRQYHQH